MLGRAFITDRMFRAAVQPIAEAAFAIPRARELKTASRATCANELLQFLCLPRCAFQAWLVLQPLPLHTTVAATARHVSWPLPPCRV